VIGLVEGGLRILEITTPKSVLPDTLPKVTDRWWALIASQDKLAPLKLRQLDPIILS